MSFGTVAAALLLAACGSQRQDVAEPRGNFSVQIAKAQFPSAQRLSEHTHLVIAVKNTGNKAIPNVAVTITDPHYGTADAAFNTMLPAQEGNQLGLASRSRPVWIVDHAPEREIVSDLAKARPYCRFSCQSGGPGGATTAYSNTWAAGSLQPGAIAVFDWGVTAVRAGRYTIQYQIAAGLNGKAKAQLSGGGRPIGRLQVSISSQPAQGYVTDSGGVVSK